ncbi:hypothetical protein CYMTET_24164 [Cymbomonas tetramitiformis]|uniref:Uncharacterized protein n=1 Tax=Cymbomonas tetramitiformis TaxID=36881 RepID=A0AAE0FWX7_9CHLO|nr:hypothetical protein CYMTET_24164 [Cymbomonas tetramitiformis]
MGCRPSKYKSTPESTIRARETPEACVTTRTKETNPRVLFDSAGKAGVAGGPRKLGEYYQDVGLPSAETIEVLASPLGVSLSFLLWLQKQFLTRETAGIAEPECHKLSVEQLVLGKGNTGSSGASPIQWCLRECTAPYNCSFVQWCQQNSVKYDLQNEPFFAPPTHFVSHTWEDSFDEILTAITKHLDHVSIQGAQLLDLLGGETLFKGFASLL